MQQHQKKRPKTPEARKRPEGVLRMDIISLCGSAADGGLRDGGLSKSEDIWGKRPFSSVFWISLVLFAPSEKGQKRQKKGGKGQFRPISRKGGHPLSTHLLHPHSRQPNCGTESAILNRLSVIIAFLQESRIDPWPRYFWKVWRYISHFYRDTFAKVRPPLGRK